MKQIASTLLLTFLLTVPLQAEEEKKPADRLMDFFNWFSSDGEAFIDEFMAELGPQLEALRDHVEDWTLYEAPEVLENGDIIIRRKPKIETEEEPGELKPDGTREI